MTAETAEAALHREQPADGAGFVLLHGAMLGSWIWERLVPLLNRPALAVDLPGRGARPVDVRRVSLQDAIDSVGADIDAFPARRVVLVAHSLSGIVVPALLSRFPGRIAHAVFVSAAIPIPGKAYLDVLPAAERLFFRLILRLQKKGALTPAFAARSALCNDLDPATTERVLAGLTREAPRFYTDPVPGRLSPAIPNLYVRLSEDRAVSTALQEASIERLPDARVETLETGHLPMLGQPERLAAILDAVDR